MRRRAGIERELVSRADQRVLRWLRYVERMDEYYMARRVLITTSRSKRRSGTRLTEVRLDGWCEVSLEQLKNDGAWRLRDNAKQI